MGALVAATLFTAVATLFGGPAAPVAAAPGSAGALSVASVAPLQDPEKQLCTTDEWRNPSNFQQCVDRLTDLASSQVSCVKAPVPGAPDSGVAGWFATRPEAYDQPGFKGQYTRYGYAGYDYTTYDIGCSPTLMHPEYKFENTVANGELLAATGILGAANALRERAWDPSSLWGWADPLVKKATQAIYRKVFTVFGSIALVVVGLYLLWRARQADLSNAVTTAGWALLVMVAITAIAKWPTWSANAADHTLITSLAVVHDAVGPSSRETPPDQCRNPDPKGCEDNRSPALRASDTAVESLLYNAWLRGALGSSDSETAKKYGPVLYDAKSFSWGETNDIRRDPKQRPVIIEQKAQRWQKVAEQIKTEDPEAYEYLQGTKGMERIGAGLIAVLSALFFVLFDIMASVLVLLGFLIFRWAVIVAPLLGTLGLLRPASSGLRRLMNVVIAAIFNIVIFGVGAAVYLFAVDLIMTTASLPGWLQMVMVFLTGVVGWLLLRPYRRITQLGGKNAGEGVGEAGGWHRLFLRDLRAAGGLKVADGAGADSVLSRRGGGLLGSIRPESRREDAPVTVATKTVERAGRPEDSSSSTSREAESASEREVPAVATPVRRAVTTSVWEAEDVPAENTSYSIYRPGSGDAEVSKARAQRPESATVVW
jgi:hypothetical protein